MTGDVASRPPSRRRAASRDWGVALAYIAFIYATLGVVGIPLTYLRDRDLLRPTLAVLFCAVSIVIVVSLVRHRALNAGRMVILGATTAGYVLIARTLSRPEEQIHFLEYGLVGFLFLRAVRHHVHRRRLAAPLAVALAGAAGFLDEWIQGRLPNRHYDVHDVFINVVSAALGLLVYALFLPRWSGND